jgi:phosphatidylethanolamine/phosphatidyl-N-methylethanolamine N-methyltransferase
MPSNTLPFFRGWSRNPAAVGLPIPSSPWTARRLAQATLDAAITGGGPVLELGAGAGAVTQALIDAGCALDELVVVERDAELCRTLEQRFPGLCVLHGDALHVAELLTTARIASVSVVLCGLPMRAVAPAAAIHCYSGAFRSMPHGGAIIQYTYGFKSPVDPGRSPPHLDATFVGREWRNVPPMAIWSYRLPAPRPSTHLFNGRL